MELVILLVLTMTACLVHSIIKKGMTGKYLQGSYAGYIHTVVVSSVVALSILLISNISSFSYFTLWTGLAFGVLQALQQIFMLCSLSAGPLGYSIVIISLSMLMPTLSGALFWDEKIYPIQLVGVVFMIGCMVLSVDTSDKQKKGSLKWLLYCGLTFLATGLIGIVQKWHQSSPYKAELDLFLMISFSFAAVCAAVVILWQKSRSPNGKEEWEASVICLRPLPLVLMIFNGILLTVNNKINLMLAGIMDSAVMFPILNGGNVILSMLAGIVLFKERLTVRQWIGLVLGFTAVIFLCNPF